MRIVRRTNYLLGNAYGETLIAASYASLAKSANSLCMKHILFIDYIMFIVNLT